MPRDQVDQRIAAQGDIAERVRPLATRVIDTSGSVDEARARVLEAWSGALAG
jgi:dephospho-CoA kinase